MTECGPDVENVIQTFRNVTVGEFDKLHHEASHNHAYVDAAVALSGLKQARAGWAELSLAGTSLLEIGPGSGHLLAAARDAG